MDAIPRCRRKPPDKSQQQPLARQIRLLDNGTHMLGHEAGHFEHELSGP